MGQAMRVSPEMVTAVVRQRDDRQQELLLKQARHVVAVAEDLASRGCKLLSVTANGMASILLADGGGLAGLGIEAVLDRQDHEKDWFRADYEGVMLYWSVSILAPAPLPATKLVL